MTEPVRCPACGRPYNRLFTRCPFCNAPNPEAAARPAATSTTGPADAKTRAASRSPPAGEHDYASFAEQAITVSRPFLPLEFHPAAVVALDHFFDQTWGTEGAAPEQEDWQPSQAKRVAILHFGAFFGELLRREIGGGWQADATYPQNPLHSRLVLTGDVQIFPFSRVFKRMRDGAAEPLEQLHRQARQLTGVTGQAAEVDGWIRYARHFASLRREDLATTFYERALALPLVSPAARAALEGQRTAAVRAAEARAAATPARPDPVVAAKTTAPAPAPASVPATPAPATRPSALSAALAEAVRTHASRAATLAAQGRHGDALAEIERLLELSPSSPEGLLGRANALIALGRQREALDELDEISARGDCEPGRSFLSATAADQLGDAVKAARDFRRIQDSPALSLEERSRCAQRVAALAQHPAVLLEAIDGLSDTAAMMDAYERLSVARPELAAPLLERGVGLVMAGRTDEALAAFDRAAALEPGDPRCYDHKAVTLLRLQQVDQALRTLDEGLRHCPASGTLHCRRGIALATAGRNAEALAAFQSSLEVDPAYAEAWAYKGDVESRLGDSVAAVASLGRFLALRAGRQEKLVAVVTLQRWGLQNPGRTRDEARGQTCLGAGVAAYAMGRFEDARVRLEEGAAADPLESNLWLNLGAAQLQLSRTEEALASYRRAEELLGPTANVVRGEVSCLHALGRIDEALACHDRQLERGPRNPDALLGKARTLVRAGRGEEALPLYRRLVSRGPARLAYVAERADALAAAGRTREARFAYDAALALAPGDAGLQAKLAQLGAAQGSEA